MEVIVPTRSGVGRKIAFRLENVTMPFGLPLKVRTEPLAMKPRNFLAGRRLDGRGFPRPFFDSEGGSLRVPSPSLIFSGPRVNPRPLQPLPPHTETRGAAFTYGGHRVWPSRVFRFRSQMPGDI